MLIDTDIGLRNLDVVMGLENRIVYNLVDVVEGNCRVEQALDQRTKNIRKEIKKENNKKEALQRFISNILQSVKQL